MALFPACSPLAANMFRHQRVSWLNCAACTVAADGRFLMNVSADEGRLANHDRVRAGTRVEGGLMALPLAPGWPYEIVAAIGAGGMGGCIARPTRSLKRQVAIKGAA